VTESAARSGLPGLGVAFEHSVSVRPDEPFLRDPEDHELTWGQAWGRMQIAAARLADLGVGRGSVVASWSVNELDLFVTMLACWSLGAIFSAVNVDQPEPVLNEMTQRIRATVCVVDGNRDLPAAGDETAVMRLADLFEGGSPTSERAPVWSDPTAPAFILFTSGSTGTSKACVLDNRHLAWGGEEWARSSDMTREDSVITLGSLCHVNAIWGLGASLVNGTRHTFERRFSASRFWPRAEAAGATMFDYVGAVISILLRTPPPTRPTPIRVGLGGGARVEDILAFRERFGPLLLESYGLSECMNPINQREREFKLGSIGKVTRPFDARVVDAEGAPAEQGELQLRPKGPGTVFVGYLGDPEATANAFTDDGWFRTSDVVRHDTDGYFYFIERDAQLIRRRGENISAFDLEGVFLEHPAIRYCAAVGVPAELGDDDVLLAVEPEDDAVVDPSELLSWVRGRVAPFMVPRYVRFMELPMTPSERVRKHEIRRDGVTADTYDGEADGTSPSRA